MAVVDSTSRGIPWRRFDGIDLLRGLAIFFVLMNHVNIRLLGAKVLYTRFLPVQLTHFLVWNAQLGVQIFFSVSGFLITSIAFRRWGSLSQVPLRGFYLFRFARIAPLLFLLLAVLSSLHFGNVTNYVVPARTGGLGRALLAALMFHVNELEIHRGYLPGSWDILWSLSVEEMFYLFFPLVCVLFAGQGRFGRGKVFVALLSVFVVLGPFGRTAFAHGSEIASEYSFLGGMDGIALGCLTALIVARKPLSRRTLRVLGMSGTAIVVASLVFSWHAYRGWLGGTGLNFTLLSIGTCMFIAATTQAQWRSPRVLAPLLRMGRYSYEIYLTHMFVVFTSFGLFLRAGKPMRWVPVLFISVMVISGLLGAAVANFYSEPLNRFLRGPAGAGGAVPSAPDEPVGVRDGAVARHHS